jgi:hypothetical protein
MARRKTQKTISKITCSRCHKTSSVEEIIIERTEQDLGFPTIWLTEEDYSLLPLDMIAMALLSDGIIPLRLIGEDKICPHCKCHYTYKDLEKAKIPLLSDTHSEE